MTQVSEIMSTELQTVEPQQSLRTAAKLMRDCDVGALPVCQDRQLLGMVTDRDIAVRGVADGLDGDTACVSDVMSGDPRCATVGQDTREVMQLMGELQLRRLPVVDDQRRLVGIVALADLALRQDEHIDETVREISDPSTSS